MTNYNYLYASVFFLLSTAVVLFLRLDPSRSRAGFPKMWTDSWPCASRSL